jgi:hypothetical protein
VPSRQGKERSRFFEKKRRKKLLLFWDLGVGAAEARREQKSFWFFCERRLRSIWVWVESPDSTQTHEIDRQNIAEAGA